LFRRDAAATDAKPRKRYDFCHQKDGLYAAKQRPGFPTNTPEARAPQTQVARAKLRRDFARKRFSERLETYLGFGSLISDPR
jgi:hypothetical protein